MQVGELLDDAGLDLRPTLRGRQVSAVRPVVHVYARTGQRLSIDDQPARLLGRGNRLPRTEWSRIGLSWAAATQAQQRQSAESVAVPHVGTRTGQAWARHRVSACFQIGREAPSLGEEAGRAESEGEELGPAFLSSPIVR